VKLHPNAGAELAPYPFFFLPFFIRGEGEGTNAGTLSRSRSTRLPPGGRGPPRGEGGDLLHSHQGRFCGESSHKGPPQLILRGGYSKKKVGVLKSVNGK